MDFAALVTWAEAWPFVAGLLVAVAAFTLVWLLHLPLRDASIVDVLWGPAFVLVGGTYAVLSEWIGPGGPRRWLVLLLISLWAFRLGGYLLWRRWGEPEDARYRAMRSNWGAAFPWISLPIVFWLQAAICWIVSWPLFEAIRAGESQGLNGIDLLGVVLFAFGFLFETVADAQLARFKAHRDRSPGSDGGGRVMDRGLWRYSRHPNYFGECVLWWGFGLIALATGPGAWWALASPLLMTVLLLRVSGVTLLESHLRESRPGYVDYVRRTNAFVPGRPRD